MIFSGSWPTRADPLNAKSASWAAMGGNGRQWVVLGWWLNAVCLPIFLFDRVSGLVLSWQQLTKTRIS